MHVTNMNSPRTGKPVANQFIIMDGDITVFQSYYSTIATIDGYHYTMTIGRDWDYSVTTGRYRNEFMRRYGFDDMDSLDGMRVALDSGETVDRWGHVWKVVKDF